MIRRPNFFLLSVGSVIAVAVLILLQKISYLAAEPQGEKDCPPLVTAAAPAEATTQSEFPDPYGNLNWSQKGGYINDVSCLNRTPVYGIVKITSEQDIADTLSFVKERNLSVSMAGVKHSMGGQAFGHNVVVMDMKAFNTIKVSEATQTVTVQSGATWHDIQNLIHPKYAISAMQSTDIFTVGGSISVNAHGMDHHAGSVGSTIKSMRVMLADGSIKTVSKTENPELFKLVVGGYGLFGVILDAELAVTQNEIYNFTESKIKTADFPDYFAKHIAAQDEVRLFYGHLSTAPSSLLDEMIIYKYAKAEAAGTEIKPLTEPASVKLKRFTLNFSKTGSFAKEVKWWAEKNIEPHLVACTLNRNQALTDGESCLVSRNEPMHDSVPYLKNNLRNETDILQEYYVPQQNLPEFITGMKTILQEQNSNLLNASVRVVHAEDTLLSYATQDMFAVVIYVNQPTTQVGNERMQQLTSQLIDLAASLDGTFFLPYQLHYSPAQLKQSYPMITDFFAAKKKYDPTGIFTNTFYEKYKDQV